MITATSTDQKKNLKILHEQYLVYLDLVKQAERRAAVEYRCTNITRRGVSVPAGFTAQHTKLKQQKDCLEQRVEQIQQEMNKLTVLFNWNANNIDHTQSDKRASIRGA